MTDPLLGTILAERYRLEALLGEGGMGKVYAAQHILMRKRLAVKVLHRQLTQVPEVVQRFEREAMAAAHIDHPNVAAATDFGKLRDGSVYLVLEFVEGRSLRDEISAGPLAVGRALHIGRQIASAVAAAHHLSIVHRDLKPENVMLVEKGGDSDFVKVLDFGIAKVPMGDDGGAGEGKPITKAGMVYGTPEYMAPEQALGQNVDGRADLYALGVILYEMLVGVRPFTGKSQVGILGQQLTQQAPSFAQRAPGTAIPPVVESLVLRLLAREVDERCQTAVEVLSSLDVLVGAVAPGEGRLFTLFGGSPSSVVGTGGAQPGAAPVFSAPPLSVGGLAVEGGAPSAGGRGSFGSHPGVVLVSPPETSVPQHVEAAAPTRDVPGPALAAPPALSAQLLSQLNDAATYLEQRRDLLPNQVRAVVGHLPGRVLLAAVGLVGVCLVLGVILLVAGPSSEGTAAAQEHDSAGRSAEPTPASPPAADSLEGRIAQAEAAGLEALVTLAGAEPREGKVFVALAAARAKSGAFPSALDAVSQALALDPKLYESPRIAGVLFRAAQSQDASAAAFRLLRGPMGIRGADIIYDLAHTRGVRLSVQSEATKIVRSAEFGLSASPALAVALDLKQARTCTQFKGLLERAKNVGDGRALESLQALTKKTGCGSGKQGDCYPCLRKDQNLVLTIDTIQKRIAPPPDQPAAAP